jgi:hypothetical protein
MLFWEIAVVYSKNHVKLINTHYGQNAELLHIKTGGIYSYHCAYSVNACCNKDIWKLLHFQITIL